MKLKYYAQYLLMCLLVPSFYSCDKLVEVTPKTAIEDNRFFNNEAGFTAALNGVYLQMGRSSQYGRELTFGLPDVLGGMYVLSSSNGSTSYRDAFAGSYTNSGPQSIINNIWLNQYNSIANLNKLIFELSKADVKMFTENNYKVIKGEAYALRAFLHFDLLRLFGKSYVDGGADIAAIPYVTDYNTAITGKLTSMQVIEKILADLAIAEEVLKDADPIYTGQSVTNNTYLQNRNLRFNYYAVKATQAKVNLWINNKAEAQKAAEEVIAVSASKFPWILQSNIATSTETSKDRIFSTELIFALYANNLETNYADLLDGSKFTSMLIINSSRITTQFETATVGLTDYRNIYMLRIDVTTPNGTRSFYGKLYQPSGLNETYAKRMPILRISEMYYIAAECLKETDPATAIGYLNTVRQKRGITATLSASLTPDQIQTEIGKEYFKEFTCEGQMWYYYKRLNATAIPGITGTFSSSRYVLPLPTDETQFGF